MRATAIGLALSLLVCQVARTIPAAAQTAEELEGARKLFADALADQEARRYDTALEKFKRVAAVKDSANVRYRIASCLEALGRRAEALSNFEASVKLGEQEKAAPDVMRAAREHAAELDRVVPRLTIVLPSDAPATTDVRVDDAPVDRAALAEALPLDVGHHTIRATAPGDSPFETAVTLPEGGHVSITVTLTPLPPTKPPPGPALGKGQSDRSGEGEKHPPVTGHPSHVGAWIAIGVGGALAAGSVVSFLLRQSNINTINNDCGPNTDPQGRLVCHPGVSQDEVHSAQDAARWQGPLAIGLGAGAVVGVGLGVWLLATTPSQSVSVAPAFLRDGGLLVVQGRM
jgi:hypothetical protein